jgi:hypothetical protein
LAAHRKGSDYKRVLQEEGVDDDPVREVVLMLAGAVRMLDDLAEHEGVSLTN